MDFAQARMYANKLGRFTSPDYFANDAHTLAPQSWNLYVYVRNNPLYYVDRNGKEIAISFYEKNSQNKLEQRNLTYDKEKRILVDSDGNQYDGGSKIANAALNYINKFVDSKGGTGAAASIGRLIDSSTIHAFEIIEGGDPGGTTRSETSSTVGFDLSNSAQADESFVALGVAIDEQDTLVSNPDAVYAVGPDGRVQSRAFFSDDGGTAMLTPLEESAINASFNIRESAGITQITNARAASVPLVRVCRGIGCQELDSPDPPLGPPPPPPTRKNATEINRRP